MNDQELIPLLQQGDEPAFRWLVETYRNRVFHTALNIVQDEKEAEDVAQETFIQVFESVAAFKGESSLSTWIYRITVRKAIDKTRRKKARTGLRKWLPAWMPDERKSDAPGFFHPSLAAEQKEKAAVLFRAISRLPEKQRLAFTLVKVQGMKYEEACAIMDQQLKAVESLITRAKQNLQKELEQYYKNS